MRLYHLICEVIYGLLLPLAFIVACAAGSYGCLNFLSDYARHKGGSFHWVEAVRLSHNAPETTSKPSVAGQLAAKRVAPTEIDASAQVEPQKVVRSPSQSEKPLRSPRTLGDRLRLRLGAIRSSLRSLRGIAFK